MSTHLDLTDIEREISMTDMKDDLMVYCYEECNDESNPRIKECRGIVTDHSGNIVLKTFGYTPEYSCIDTYNSMFNDMFPDIKNYKIFDSQEGCLIRMFCHNEKWYITTHKKLDAYKSKWSSKESFGEMFENALYVYYKENSPLQLRIGSNLTSPKDVLDKFKDSLDKSRSYLFLVRNTIENRIVCAPPADYTLYYTGSFLKNGTDFNFVNVDIDTPTEHKFDTVEQMMDYVKNCDPYQLQGLMILTPNPIKIINETYWDLFYLRNNEPSVKFRYLHIRTTSDVDRFRQLYPEHKESFDKYEEILLGVARSIHECYIRRFIRKEFCTVPQEQYTIVQQCHKYYIDNISNRNAIVTPSVVTGILNQQDPTVLNKIVRKQLFDNAKNIAPELA
jgi:hypothetical protein